MACFQISQSGISSWAFLRHRPTPPRRRASSLVLHSRLQDSDGEERPESLFMKELKWRGMTQTLLLEEREAEVEEEDGIGERGRAKRRNGVAKADFSKAVLNQREKSMALNSEGLEVCFLLDGNGRRVEKEMNYVSGFRSINNRNPIN